MREGVCLDGCMFVLICGRVEDGQGSGPTSELEGGEVGRQTVENDEKIVMGMVARKCS